MYIPKVADAISTGFAVLPARMFTNAKKMTGAQVIQPWQVTKPAQGGNYAGMEEFSFADEVTEIKGTFIPRNAYHTISLSGDDLDQNQTEGQVINLLTLKMQQAEQAFGYKIATDLWSDGTGSGSKQILGLTAGIATSSDVATYGGQSRSTYSQLDTNSTASGGTLSFDNMRTVYRNAVEGPNMPTLILTTPTVWDLLESLILPTQNLQLTNQAPAQISAYGRTARQSIGAGSAPALAGISGFTSIAWKGVPVAADELATSQAMYFINEETWTWYGLGSNNMGEFRQVPINIPTVLSGSVMKTTQQVIGLSATDWFRPQKQDGYALILTLKGSLVCNNPRFNCELTGITTA